MEIISTSSLDGRKIGVLFNQVLDPSSASHPGSYHLVGGAVVNGASLRPDGVSVELDVSGLNVTNYTLTAKGVRDASQGTSVCSAQGVVQNLRSEDIGGPAHAGIAFTCAPGMIEVEAAGRDIWYSADSFYYIHQQRTGDFDVRVRLASFGPSDVHQTAKAALMLRESTDPASRHVTITAYPALSNWTAFHRSLHAGPTRMIGDTAVERTGARINWPAGQGFPNCWLRLRRVGNSVMAYGSSDGMEWVRVGKAYIPEVPFPETVYIGLATSSHGDMDDNLPMAEVVYEQFSDYTITNAAISFVQHPLSVAVTENRPATFSATAQVEGTPASNLEYRWQRNGVFIPGATERCYTISLITRADHGARYQLVASLPGGDAVISEEAILAVAADETPPAVNSVAALLGGPIAIRFNELLTAASATNLLNYVLEGGATIRQAALMEDGRTVVLSTGDLADLPHQISVKGVADLAGNPAYARIPVRQLELKSTQIGPMTSLGAARAVDASEIDIRAANGNIWTNSDSFLFVHQARTGDFDAYVQMSHLSRANDYTRGGLMVRENLASESRNFYVCTYPEASENRWASTVRLETGGTTTLSPGNGYVLRSSDFAYPNAWFRLKRVANTFTAYYGTNGVDWIQIGNQLTPFPPYPTTVHLGLATTPNDAAPAQPVTVQYRNFGDWIPLNHEMTIGLKAQKSAKNLVR